MFNSKWLYIPFNWDLLLRACERTFLYSNATGREWSSGLRRCDQNWKIQNPLGARPGVWTQPCGKAPGDLWVNEVSSLRMTKS